VNPGSGQARTWGKSIQIAAALFIFFLGLYGLTYTGHFSTDDEHILAARSLGLAFEGNLNDERVLGNDRIFAYHGLPADQSVPSLEIEPIQSLLGAGLARLSVLLGSGRVQTLFLLNIFATALAAVCVFASVRSLGYADRTALVAALVFGTGTQAWPYTQTFFRDPLAMLFLAFAWACALWLNRSGSGRTRILAGSGVVTGLGLGILTKNTVTVAIPVLAILLIPFWKSLGGRRKQSPGARHSLTVLFLVIGISLAGMLAFLLGAGGHLSRFSLRYYWELAVFFFTSPHPDFLEAVFGPLVSPGKSLFLYSPVLLLSLFSLIQKKVEGLAAWGYVLLLIIAQALFYDKLWLGNINWGLRFMAPAIPLLAIASASVIQRVIDVPKGWIWIATLGLLSGLVQVIGVSAPVGDYYGSMGSQLPPIPAALQTWNPRFSALTWTAGRMLSGGKWDLAILQAHLPGLLTAAGLAALACLAWVKIRSRYLWITLALLGCASLATLSLPKIFAIDPAYYPGRSDLREAQADLKALAQSQDGLVISSYGAPAWYYWMNWGPTIPAWVSLTFSLSPGTDIPAPVAKILEDASQAHARTWLLLPCDSPPSAALVAQKNRLPWLELVDERNYLDGTCRTSLLLFRTR
jgi:hypothetical protein